jgi:hypothetical protein
VAEILHHGSQVSEEQFIASGFAHRFEPFILPGSAESGAYLQESGG